MDDTKPVRNVSADTWHSLTTRAGGIVPTTWLVGGSLLLLPIAPGLVVGLAARRPEGVIAFSIICSLLALAMALGFEPVFRVRYSTSGLELLRWNGTCREVLWGELGCVSILLEGPSGCSLVFRVREGSRDVRFVLAIAARWQGGRAPRAIIGELAQWAPQRLIVESRRDSWKAASRCIAWFLVGPVVGVAVIAATGHCDPVAALVVTLVGLGTILLVANFGRRSPVVVEAGVSPPARVPRPYKDWIDALVRRAPGASRR